LAKGLQATVNDLVDFETTPDNLAPAPAGIDDAELPRGFYENLPYWWINTMVTTSRPLQEKMVLFWHGLFATSAANVPDFRQMYLQNENFRGNFNPETGRVLRPNPASPFPVGSFRNILEYLSKDSAMLFFLDNVYNHKLNNEVGSNENYARELHELFSMGVVDPVTGEPNYTERDIRQASRALTGWSVRQPGTRFGNNDTFFRTFFFYQDQHDFGSPQAPISHLGTRIVGGTGNQIFDNIVRYKKPGQDQSAVGRYLGFRLFKFFGYDTPEPEIINALADVFDNGSPRYNIRNLLRTIFNPGNLVSEAFYSEKAFKAHIKSPAEYLLGAYRLLRPEGVLNHPDSRWLAIYGMIPMGQFLFFPPDVSGWDEGLYWINTTFLLARYNFGHAFANYYQYNQGGIDVSGIIQRQNLRTADQVVDYFTKLLLPSPPSDQSRTTLLNYLVAGDNGQPVPFVLNRTTIDKKVRGLIHMIMTMPEFQLS
jgi:uncharacterized protein (DUF1800 family)